MKKNIAIIIVIMCAIVCIGAHLHNEYVESVKTIESLENRISQVKNDWDIYNYKGQAVTGGWLKLHLSFEMQDAKKNLGYWLFK